MQTVQAVAGDFPPGAGADPDRNAGPAYSIGGAVNGMMCVVYPDESAAKDTGI